MVDPKLILVTGATGAQGGAVARHLLKVRAFSVRAFTRKPDSDKARALSTAGAEVVKGNLEDPGTIRSALKGCHGVFGVTNYWEHFEREYDQGKNLIDAVADAGLKHFVFSTLPYAKTRSGETLDVPHFNIKGRLEDYTRTRGIPTTFLHVAFYYENLLYFFPPKRQDDGSYAFAFPQGDTPLAGVAVEDVGGVVAKIFSQPEKFIGRTVGVVADELPPARYAEVMSGATGKRVTYNHIPRETFASFGFPGAEDVANMFEFYRLHVPSRKPEIDESRSLYPGMQRFEQWAAANAGRLKEATA